MLCHRTDITVRSLYSSIILYLHKNIGILIYLYKRIMVTSLVSRLIVFLQFYSISVFFSNFIDVRLATSQTYIKFIIYMYQVSIRLYSCYSNIYVYNIIYLLSIYLIILNDDEKHMILLIQTAQCRMCTLCYILELRLISIDYYYRTTVVDRYYEYSITKLFILCWYNERIVVCGHQAGRQQR